MPTCAGVDGEVSRQVEWKQSNRIRAIQSLAVCLGASYWAVLETSLRAKLCECRIGLQWTVDAVKYDKGTGSTTRR